MLHLCNFGNDIDIPDQDECLHEEAEVSMVYYIIKYAQNNPNSVVYATVDDTDAFVILLDWVYKLNIKSQIFIKHFDGKFISINATVEVLGEKCLDIMCIHAMTGTDTNGYLYRKGKLVALKLLNNGKLSKIHKVIGDNNATNDELQKCGISFMHHMYGESKIGSIARLRRKVYDRLKNPLVKSLPPTEENICIICYVPIYK